MATDIEIANAFSSLEKQWDDDGMCPKCYWHSCLYEHYIDKYDIAEAIDKYNGVLKLYCQNEDSDCNGVIKIKL